MAVVLVCGYTERVKKYFWAGTTILLVIILIIIVPSIARAAWYNASWPYRVAVTIQASEVDADLTDFPVYIDLSDLPAEFHTNVNSDGGDIRVTQSDGITEVPREVVFYNAASDTGELHFKGTLSSSVDTTFYIYYGNSGASDYAIDATYGAENVWDSNFKGVYHLQETVNTTPDGYAESTAGTAHGTGVSMSETESPVKLGNGQGFDGTADQIVANSVFGLGNTDVTISAWVNLDSTLEGGAFVKIGLEASGAASNNNGFGIGVGQSSFDNNANNLILLYEGVRWIDTNDDIGTGVHHVAMTVNGSGVPEWYIDGVSGGTSPGTSAYAPTAGAIKIGGYTALGGAERFADAFVDEVRISNMNRGADWIAVEYSNQNTPATFYSVGTEELEPKSSMVRINNGTLRINNGTVRIR